MGEITCTRTRMCPCVTRASHLHVLEVEGKGAHRRANHQAASEHSDRIGRTQTFLRMHAQLHLKGNTDRNVRDKRHIHKIL